MELNGELPNLGRMAYDYVESNRGFAVVYIMSQQGCKGITIYFN